MSSITVCVLCFYVQTSTCSHLWS